jgi:hypothetical protein
MTPEQIAEIEREYHRYPVRIAIPTRATTSWARWWFGCRLCLAWWPFHDPHCPHGMRVPQ